MKNQYFKKVKSKELDGRAVDRLLDVFKGYGFRLNDLKDSSLLTAQEENHRITELVSELDLYVCTGIRSWNGLIIGFPGKAEDLTTENIETPYLRKILYPIMDLFNRTQEEFGKLDCLYIVGSRFNEVFRLKMSLLEYAVPNLVFLTDDLLKCTENAKSLPKKQTRINEAWIQRELCEKMTLGEYGMQFYIKEEEVNLKLLAYEVPTNEGTKNPERLDILSYDSCDGSLVAFEIKGETGRVELENLYLQGMAHRNWLEQNKRAIKFLFSPNGLKGKSINTRKRVRLMLGFCGDKIPELFSHLKEQAKNRDKHLKVDFIRFALPSRPESPLRLDPAPAFEYDYSRTGPSDYVSPFKRTQRLLEWEEKAKSGVDAEIYFTDGNSSPFVFTGLVWDELSNAYKNLPPDDPYSTGHDVHYYPPAEVKFLNDRSIEMIIDSEHPLKSIVEKVLFCYHTPRERERN